MASISLLIASLGAIVGLSVGLIGIGSILAVPLLVYGAGLGVHKAICVAMVTMTLLGFTGSVQKLHAGTINLRAAAVLAIFGALSAPVGAWLNKQLRPTLLLAFFALAVFAISIQMLLKRDHNQEQVTRSRRVARSRGLALFSSVFAGTVIGLLGGLLGISGGFIAVPVLVTYQGMDMHRAVATSWAIVAVVSAFATAGHFLAGQRVPVGATLCFAISGLAGFEIASRVARRLSEGLLNRLFAAVVSVMSLVMLSRFLVTWFSR